MRIMTSGCQSENLNFGIPDLSIGYVANIDSEKTFLEGLVDVVASNGISNWRFYSVHVTGFWWDRSQVVEEFYETIANEFRRQR